MDLKHTYSVAEVLEIYHTLKPEEKEEVQAKIQKPAFNEKEILDIISPFHTQYETTYKALS
jgi:hypothetical protein